MDPIAIGKTIKQQYPAYANMSDDTIGELYLKKFHPTEYDVYKKQREANVESEKELNVARQKQEQEYEFKKSHPNPPSTSDVTNISQTKNLLDTIDQSLEYLNRIPDSELGGLKGGVNQHLINSPLGFLVGGDVGNLGRNLLVLQGLGDRQIMGGRLIRDLVQRFQGAFPALQLTKNQIRDRLNYMRQGAQTSAQVEAKRQGYKSSDDLFNNLGLSVPTSKDKSGINRIGNYTVEELP